MDMLRLIGIIIFAIGLLIFLFGKQFILIRLYFRDRSVFSQLFWGVIIAFIGCIFLYLGGTFS